MALTRAEFEAILQDRSKTIEGDLAWADDEDHSPCVEFRAEVASELGYPLFVRASYNAVAGTLSYGLIHPGVGRIYALDLGKDHHNPSCEQVGETHKHTWSDLLRDKEAYAPPEITAGAHEPVLAWEQFCLEAAIDHRGQLRPPPPVQMELN